MRNIKKEHKGTLSEEKINFLKKEIKDSLSIDRHSLIYDYPFTASISMRMNLIPVRDKRCRTACTDGNNVFFDCDFYLKLKKAERQFVLAHEIWHCILLHLSRCQSRNTQIFNIASDMEVNNLLIEHIEKKGITPPKKVLFPPDNLKGKSAEEIYEYLIKQKNKKSKSQNNLNNESSFDSENDSTELDGQFDKHIYSNENDDIDDNDDIIKDQWGEVGYDEDFMPEISKDFAEKMREAIISATQQYQHEKGDLPFNISGIITEIVKPEISWREYLSQFVSTCYSGQRRWLPPNRRYVYNNMYFQSRRNEQIEGVVAIDTSGSCVSDLSKFFSELKGLINSFGNYKLTVICADAAVEKVDIYDSYDNPLEFFDDDINIEWAGGGGTDYGPVFKYIEKNCNIPDFLIYLGDGYASMSYKKKPNYPVLWLITKNGYTDFCDWGKKIIFKN